MPAFASAPVAPVRHRNAVEMFEARVRRSPLQPALRHKVRGAWQTLTWAEWDERARALARGLRRAGIERGDRVALLSRTRLEWVVADVAIAMAGAVSVPIYPSLTAEHVAHILADSGSKLLLVDDPAILADLSAASVPELSTVVVFDGSREGPSEFTTRRLADLVLELEGEGASGEADLVPAAAPDDPFTYVYTSGTTGEPKGAVLTHANILYEAWAMVHAVVVDHTDEQLLVLPLAHIFARHLVWGAIEAGAVSAFAESEDRIRVNLQEIAPTFLAGVPRMYERTYAALRSAGARHGMLGQAAFDAALEVGRRVSSCQQRGRPIPLALSMQLAVADRVALQRIRAFFGGRLRFLVCGGAPLSREIAEFFHAAGVLVLEGYGLSETTGAVTVNRPERFRFGTVGPALPGCEIKIADDGEILVRGPNVMARYHGPQPATEAAPVDEEGFFRTGDLGELVDGFLRITGRKKHLFKTDSGKYVAPQRLEQRLLMREGIAQAVVVGDGRPFVGVLLALDEETMLALSDREGFGCRAYADLAVHPRVRQLIARQVDAVNDTLARHEAIRRFEILPRPLDEASGELTPTRKVRRTVVEDRYADLIERMYTRLPHADGGGQRS
jgi:long-chain acyl-CoA synthetase